jgi:hypothetical protein
VCVGLSDVSFFGEAHEIVLPVSRAICVIVIVNDDQQDATILAYFFIPNQLYMFRAMISPIIRST